MTLPGDTILETLCVYMHVQKQTKKLHWKIYNVVVVYNIHLTAALHFCVCKPNENGKNENSKCYLVCHNKQKYT